MFTVKFFSEPDPVTYERKLFMVEAETVHITPPSRIANNHIVTAKTKAGVTERAIRFRTHDERSRDAVFLIGEEPYEEAIVENSNGKTTHIVRAKQPEPGAYYGTSAG